MRTCASTLVTLAILFGEMSISLAERFQVKVSIEHIAGCGECVFDDNGLILFLIMAPTL